MRQYSIQFECPEYLIINKDPGLLCQSSKNADDEDLITLLEKDRKEKLHLLTRLDRPVGGICIVSRSKSFTAHYIEQQSKGLVIKRYLALVEGHLELKDSQQTHFGIHNTKSHKMIIVDPENKNAKSMTSTFNSLIHLDRYSLMQLEFNRGRFHQLRSQCSHLGHPIKGDVKYGARRSNRDRTIHLYSYQLQFQTPDSKEILYQADLPKNDHLWSLINDKLNSLNG